MIEKDNIKELFSKGLENHASPVRPEVWSGLQAKMAAAGVSSVGGGAAAKGLSALTKWLIGSAAVTGTAVVTTLAVMNSSDEARQQQPVPVKTEQSSVVSEKIPGTDSPQQTAASSGTDAPEQPVASIVPVPNVVEWNDAELHEALQPTENRAVASGGETQQSQVAQNSSSQQHSGQETKQPGNQQESGAVTAQQTDAGATTQGETSSQQRTFEAAKIVLPNVFTPNGDQDNDFYDVKQLEHADFLGVVIIGAGDKDVYTSTDPNFAWDGNNMYTGEQAPAGPYVCVLIYKDMNGKTNRKQQPFDLKR